jgi:hypothetical protein
MSSTEILLCLIFMFAAVLIFALGKLIFSKPKNTFLGWLACSALLACLLYYGMISLITSV